MSRFKTTDIVDFISSHARTEPEEVGRLLRERFPGLSEGQARKAIEILRYEGEQAYREAREEYEEECVFIAHAKRMYEGLPPNTTFDEAVRIKAAEGDRWAIDYVKSVESPQSRIRSALLFAAFERHPDWMVVHEGLVEYIGKEENPSQITEDMLIDWMQMTYPAEARQIEDSVLAGGAK